MPRKPQVSRTMHVVSFNCLCVDVESGKTTEKTALVWHAPKKASRLEKVLDRMLTDEHTKYIKILNSKRQKAYLTMDEVEYMKNATIVKLEDE